MHRSSETVLQQATGSSSETVLQQATGSSSDGSAISLSFVSDI